LAESLAHARKEHAATEKNDEKRRLSWFTIPSSAPPQATFVPILRLHAFQSNSAERTFFLTSRFFLKFAEKICFATHSGGQSTDPVLNRDRDRFCRCWSIPHQEPKTWGFQRKIENSIPHPSSVVRRRHPCPVTLIRCPSPVSIPCRSSPAPYRWHHRSLSRLQDAENDIFVRKDEKRHFKTAPSNLMIPRPHTDAAVDRCWFGIKSYRNFPDEKSGRSHRV
jgi:hypothetical protein